MISCHICDEDLYFEFIWFFRHLIDHDLDRVAVKSLWKAAKRNRS